MVIYRESITWPAAREDVVLARSTGAEVREIIILSSHDNVAPTDAVPIDPSKGVTQTQKVYRAGTIVALITVAVGAGEDERGRWGPFDPTQTDDGRDAQAASFLQEGAGNSQIRFTARKSGFIGRSISVTLVDPGAPAALSVAVVDNADGTEDITVNLGRDAGGLISTADQVCAAVNAHVAASALVYASRGTASNGTGVVAAAVQAYLAAERGNARIAVLPKDVNVQFGPVAVGAYTRNCVFRESKLRGYSGHAGNVNAALADMNSEVVSISEVTA